MIQFEVKLICVPPMDKLSGWEVFDLMANATHVGGDLWLFEGDEECLLCRPEVLAEGVTEGTGDMEDMLGYCKEIFDYDFDDAPASWEMLKYRRENMPWFP